MAEDDEPLIGSSGVSGPKRVPGATRANSSSEKGPSHGSCGLCHGVADVWPRIETLSFKVRYPAKMLLLNEGDPPEEVIVLCSGAVRLFSRRRNGSLRVFRIARWRDLLGLASVLLNEPYAFSAVTLEPCHLRIMQRNAFLGMLDAEPMFWKQVCLVGAKCHVDTLSEIKKDPLVR